MGDAEAAKGWKTARNPKGKRASEIKTGLSEFLVIIGELVIELWRHCRHPNLISDVFCW